MALPATHIQFALDLKDRYVITDLSSYIAGSVYPDSRYVTGLNRAQTHNDALLSDDRLETDFGKGWRAHVLCDRLGAKAASDLLPELFVDAGPMAHGTKQWVIRTAIKIIQDIYVFETHSTEPYLTMLDAMESPNGESTEAMKQYISIVKAMYEGKERIDISDAVTLWRAFGIRDELVDRVVQKAVLFFEDSDIHERIRLLYERTCAMTKQ